MQETTSAPERLASLERLVERMEREHRRWKRAGTLLALGLVGIVLMVFGSPGWLLLGLFVAYILLALFAVPMKIRYALPMLPTLCLFAGASVERVWVAARARAK